MALIVPASIRWRRPPGDGCQAAAAAYPLLLRKREALHGAFLDQLLLSRG
jgi:hypothetical protein